MDKVQTPSNSERYTPSSKPLLQSSVNKHPAPILATNNKNATFLRVTCDKQFLLTALAVQWVKNI
jgi:hypothetical protein